MSAARRLDVVAVTYSPGETLAAFLTSLTAATTAEVRVILADNDSRDGVPEQAASTDDRVTLLPTGGNLGFGRAANLGVAQTDSEWVLVANPDLEFDPGSLDALLDAAERWPRAGSLGPVIRNVDGSVYPSARELPELGAGIGHALFVWWWAGNPWSARYRRDRDSVSERPAGWLSGSCLLLRRVAFDSVGGFDSRFFMYFEDLDLGDRLGQAGWQNIYVPDAGVVHLGGHSTSRTPSAMMAEHHRSALIYLSRKYPGLRWLGLRLAVRLGLAARLAVVNRVSLPGPVRQSTRPDPTRGST